MVLQNEQFGETGALLEYNESPLEIPLDLSTSSRSSSTPKSFHTDRNELATTSNRERLIKIKCQNNEEEILDDFECKNIKIEEEAFPERAEGNAECHFRESSPRQMIRVRPDEDILKREYLSNDYCNPRPYGPPSSPREISTEPLKETLDRAPKIVLEDNVHSTDFSDHNSSENYLHLQLRGRSPISGKRSYSVRKSMSPHRSLYTPPQFENLSLKGDPYQLKLMMHDEFARRQQQQKQESSKLFNAVTRGDPNYSSNSACQRYYGRSRSPSLPNDRICSRSQSPYANGDSGYYRRLSPCVPDEDLYRRPQSPSYNSDNLRPPTPDSPAVMDTNDNHRRYLTPFRATYHEVHRSSLSPEYRSPESRTPVHVTLSCPMNDNSDSSVNSKNNSSVDIRDLEYNKSSSSPDNFRESSSSPEASESGSLRRPRNPKAYKKDMLKRFCKCSLIVWIN